MVLNKTTIAIFLLATITVQEFARIRQSKIERRQKFEKQAQIAAQKGFEDTKQSVVKDKSGKPFEDRQTSAVHGWVSPPAGDLWVSGFLESEAVKVAIAAVQQDGLALRETSDDIKNTEKVVLAAVQKRGYALQFASKRLKGFEKVVLAAVQQNGLALQFASDDMKNTEKVVLAAVQQNGYALRDTSDDMKNIEKVVLAAVQSQGTALIYASDDWRDTEKIVLAAVQQDGSALMYASNDMKKNGSLILASREQKRQAKQAKKDAVKGRGNDLRSAGGAATLLSLRSAMQEEAMQEERDDDDLELQEVLALSLNAAVPASAASQEHALRNYELFHQLKRGSATHAQVAASSSGIDGWAMSPQTAQHEAEALRLLGFMPHAVEEGAAQGEPDDPRPVRAGDDLEAKALQRALLASVGVKFDGMDKEQQSDDDEAD